MHPTLQALIERDLLVCVGPLVTTAAGLAGPRQLAERCIDLLSPERPERPELLECLAAGEIARALERSEQLMTSARFTDLAAPLLDRGDARLPLVVRAVAALSPALRWICTTNLDTLLERALDRWPAFDHEPRDLDARPRAIIKLCGSAARVSSWVLTHAQLAARPAELPCTGAWLRRHALLIVGYRADDELLRRMVLAQRGRPGDALGPAGHAFVPEGSITPAARALCDDHAIELVPIAGDYDLGAAEWLHALIAAYEHETGSRLADQLPDLGDGGRYRYGGRSNPFPGLRPFSRESGARLFGRDADVQRAVEQLHARPGSRWLIVHGPDGVGASVFAAAGLYPALLRDTAPMHPHAPVARGLRGWLTRRPLRALADGLGALRPTPDGEPDPRWAPDALFARLDASARAVTDLLAASELRGLVLLIDGLEEAIDSDDCDQRHKFAAALAHALAHAPGPLLLITPIRSRYLGELHRLPQLHERTLGADPPVYYGLAPMQGDQLRQVIHGPAARAGILVAERFVTRILADLDLLAHEPFPPPPGHLLMMFGVALSETFKRSKYGELCVDNYEAAGGLTGAIDGAAEAALAAPLEQYGEPALRRFFLAVIAGDRDASGAARPLTRDEVYALLKHQLPADGGRTQRVQAREFMRELERGGLLSVLDHRVALGHPALLSQWTRLRDWQLPRAPPATSGPDREPDPPSPPGAAARPWDLWRYSLACLLVGALGVLLAHMTGLTTP